MFDEIVKSALKDVARPYKPNEDAASYLGDFFFAILTSLHGRSRVAELVVLHLSANPLLVPLLAERLLDRPSIAACTRFEVARWLGMDQESRVAARHAVVKGTPCLGQTFELS